MTEDMAQELFQSTSSARRTTNTPFTLFSVLFHFNPRPPRGGRQSDWYVVPGYVSISIHVLREEDDVSQNIRLQLNDLFQSTSSARRTTRNANNRHNSGNISIHVLREEDDLFNFLINSHILYFNPRPPRGGRHTREVIRRGNDRISIHVLREEDDALL